MPSTTPFSERIDRLHRLIASADRILIGAGAGVSAAAGLDYAGPDFEREFAPWITRYGITDLYSSSFYPFDTEEERWAYWARHIWFARFRPDGLPLYRQLRQLLAGKELFVITTNVDAQFEKAGFPTARIFATQGDYAYLQARSGRPQTLVYNASWVTEAMAATRDCRIPSSLVPRHPSTGELMSPNLRCDATFVEDDHWHAQADAYHTFLDASCRGRLLLLEFGVGYNTPGIIRFPFERLTARHPDATLVRFNRDYPESSEVDPSRYVAFTEPIDEVIK
jgi:SIR2 family protein